MNKKRKIGITLLVIICIVIGVGLIVDKVTEFKTDNSKIENIIREQGKSVTISMNGAGNLDDLIEMKNFKKAEQAEIGEKVLKTALALIYKGL